MELQYDKIIKQASIPLALLFIGLATHFAWFGMPASAVFDEVHFGKFISAYFTYEYYFDIHPPLGKLILAGWGWLWGFQPGFSFNDIGDAYPDRLYLALRFLPALAGSLLPLVIYGIARRLHIGKPAALLAGAFMALDNALLVQSRLILLDSFLLLFGFGAVWCYLASRDSTSYKLQAFSLLSAGLLGGMAISIKWTGLTFLAIIGILELIRLWRQFQVSSFKFQVGRAIVCLAVVPIAIYAATFATHFALLGKPGPGDAFMSPGFRSRPVAMRIVELNREMYRANARLTATHPYSSAWRTWPFMQRPIFYWVEGQARIYLLGNPVVWWGSTVAVLVALGIVLGAGIRRADRTLLLLLGAWGLNLVPFIGIGRVMFLYHYFPALVWAVLIGAWFMDRIPNPRTTVIALGALAFGMFLFFAPLSYGLPLSDRAYSHRAWFPSWR